MLRVQISLINLNKKKIRAFYKIIENLGQLNR
jgi:hypothetical protein